VPFPALVAGAALVGWTVSRIAPRWLPPAPDRWEDGADNDHVVDRMIAAGAATHTAPSWRRAALRAAVLLALWFAPVALAFALLGRDHVIAREGAFFSQAAVVTFGGAYAVLAYVAQRAVEDFAWLRPGEMADGLALAETTPGPLIMVLQFVGFLAAYRFSGGLDPWLAAALGAAMTTWVTFVPSFLFIFVGAPYVEALRRQAGLHAALSAITAAVVGVVLNLSVWFAVHTLFARTVEWRAGPLRLDLPVWTTLEPGALLFSAAAIWATLRLKLAMGWVLAGSAVLGVAYWGARHGL
jgi:chromate transporter